MTIWLYCLFGKERQMMPFFMRHYAPQVDHMIMLDGDSDPATKSIITQYANAEIQSTPFRDGHYDDVQYKDYIIAKYKEARRLADWVLVVDTDEILYVRHKPLRQALDDWRSSEVLAIQAQGYQMIADDFPVDDGRQIYEQVTTGFYDKQYCKMAAFDPLLNVTWSVGRHSCAIDGLEPSKTALKLLHYRFMGEQYFKMKNALNNGRRSKADIAAGRGYHTAPDYVEGRYSLAWFQECARQAVEVV